MVVNITTYTRVIPYEIGCTRVLLLNLIVHVSHSETCTVTVLVVHVFIFTRVHINVSYCKNLIIHVSHFDIFRTVQNLLRTCPILTRVILNQF